MSRPVTLTPRAERDADAAIAESDRLFGETQAKRYAALIDQAIAEIAENPRSARSTGHPELGVDVRTLRIARRGQRASHVIVFRVPADGAIEILRVLHDRMDFPSQLLAEDDGTD
jgi:toxin ParE1/3/4